MGVRLMKCTAYAVTVILLVCAISAVECAVAFAYNGGSQMKVSSVDLSDGRTNNTNAKKNTLKVIGKTVKISYKKLCKGSRTVDRVNVITVITPQGAVTYDLVSAYRGSEGKYKKYFTVSKTGRTTFKKGLPRGTYKLRIDVTASGNTKYRAITKTATVTVKVI